MRAALGSSGGMVMTTIQAFWASVVLISASKNLPTSAADFGRGVVVCP